MQKITNGITGAQAADIIYNNDLQAILQWKAEEYPTGTIVYYNGFIYKNDADTIAGDIPGRSSKWLEKQVGVKLNTEKYVPKPILEVKINSKYLTFDDAGLLPGYISSKGKYTPDKNSKTACFEVPSNAKYVSFQWSSVFYFQFTDNIPEKLGHGSTEDPFVPIPVETTRIYVPIKVGFFKADFNNDKIIFYDKNGEYIKTNMNEGNPLLEPSIMVGNNIYSIEGEELRIYRENLYSAWMPKNNYNIELRGESIEGYHGDKGRFTFVKRPGKFEVKVFDERRNLLDSKTSNIFIKKMPKKINLSPSEQSKLQVLFMGDSLIHNNQNEIGKEWLRMINNPPEEEKVIDNVVYKSPYGIGKGNVELVGSFGGPENKYEIANKLSVIMEGKKPSGTQPNIECNPFFNPNISGENIIGEDGFLNKVDFKWYFQKICGEGKFPDHIYLACGVNDIVDFNWDVTPLKLVGNRLVEVLYKMKSACDEIAKENSHVKILVMNHQFYPLNEGHYFNFSPQLQRILWAKHYKNYEYLIENTVRNGIALKSFTRFVDCASSFDIDNGYDYEDIRVNPRNAKLQNIVVDTVHMGKSGAFMYADALLRDFLYNECS